MEDDLKQLTELGLSEEQAKAVIDGPLSGLLAKRDELLGKLAKAKEAPPGDEPFRQKYEELQTQIERDREVAKGNYEAALEADRKAFEKQQKALLERAEAAEGKLNSLITSSAMKDGALAAGVDPGFLDAVSAMHASRVTIADDVAQIDGKPVGEYLSEWVKTDEGKRFAKAPTSKGAGSQGSGGTGPKATGLNLKRSEMTPVEKSKFISEHGAEAYQALPYN